MLYTILRFLMKVTGKIFFKSITVKNKELIPAKGPLMVLANHPSTFMDPIVVATMLDRDVYFLAKGELFKGSIAKWLFAKMNMIPVYRKQDDPSQMNKNKETFDKCYEHLEKGGAILMFPEGTSITERKLRPIKSGAARIVLGAEARNNFQLNTKVITIGLNYADPHKFNRDVFININTPIEAANFKESYTANNVEGSNQLTEEIRVQLEDTIIGIADSQTDDLVSEIELLYKHKLSKELGISDKDKDASFTLTKNLAEAINYFILNDPDRVTSMRVRIKEYLNNLEAINIKNTNIEEEQDDKSLIGNSIKSFLTIVLGFPFYVYGLINNVLPFEIPGWTANKVIKSIEYKGAIGMVLGMFTFLIFYSTQIYGVNIYFQDPFITAAYAISLPLSGMFTYWYFHTVGEIRAKWTLMIVFYKKRNIIANLVNEREQILAEFDKAKSEYEIINPNTNNA